MVFMHGGSFNTGTAGGFRIPGRFDNALYDGTVIADHAKVWRKLKLFSKQFTAKDLLRFLSIDTLIGQNYMPCLQFLISLPPTAIGLYLLWLENIRFLILIYNAKRRFALYAFFFCSLELGGADKIIPFGIMQNKAFYIATF